MREEIDRLQKNVDQMMKDRNLLQGNLGEEIEKLRKKITEQ